MKKLIVFLMTALMIVSLAACGKKAADSSGAAASSDPGSVDGSYAAVSIENETNDYEKKLVPLDLIPGETTDGSLYYRSISEDGGIFYEIQPEDGEEPMKVPVAESVIYVVEKAEDCKVVKVNFDYVVKGGETEHIVQYRIFSMPDTGITVNGNGVSDSVEPEDSVDADNSAEASADTAGVAIIADGKEVPGPGDVTVASGETTLAA